MPGPTVTIDAGPHDRRWCPLQFPVAGLVLPGTYHLASPGAEPLTLEVDAEGQARCILPALDARQTKVCSIEALNGSPSAGGDTLADTSGAPADSVTLVDANGQVTISVDGALVTRYVYAEVPSRPYFFPVNAPGDIGLTRAYPMVPDVPGETADHPHHRSLWIAHGEVNEADNWSEAPGHARTRHEKFDRMSSGSVTGSFESTASWLRSTGEPLLTERLGVTAWNVAGDAHVLDFTITLRANNGAVHFGDTKEGGILSVRVATSMDVPRTGRISNVFGGIDEAETWGKAAHWCDYSGEVDGRVAGIAVMDHPHSFRYPTHWHVRNYGLMTANPFAYAAYTGGLKDGSHTLADGQALTFRYRVILHTQGCPEARIAERYLDFVAPPNVTVAE